MVEPTGTYQNPVFPESFPDPFVLKYCGEYFAYCTGFARDGLAVGVSRSTNFVDWQYVGGALKPLDSEPPYYWAPEVVYDNGRFYMYYSCGNETLMEIRVAVSDRPDGGFVDTGHRLTSEEFAIDAHVFTDDDGQRYLFYATDFLTHSHIGTGTVVDRMVSQFELEGKPRPVTRAAYDWQVYDPKRIEKGGVRWHTVEGPTVFKYKRKYFEMFSGGNWQNSSYGVAYALADSLGRNGEWKQSIDGVSVLPILRTIPEKVIGPGHNSAAVGPNGRELYCVYHSWKNDERVMAIDRMGFAGERLFVNGPTYTPQIAPFKPHFTLDSPGWDISGNCDFRPNSISAMGTSRAEVATGSSCFLTELSFRSFGAAGADAEIAFGGAFGELPVFALSFSPSTGKIRFADKTIEDLHYPLQIDHDSFQHLRVEADGHFIRFKLNGLPLAVASDLELTCDRFVIETRNMNLDVRGLGITLGYENFFERENYVAHEAGWKVIGQADIRVSDGEMVISSSGTEEVIAWKGEVAGSFELAANIRLAEKFENDGHLGFAVVRADRSVSRSFVIQKVDGRAVLSDTFSGTHLPLPSSFQEEVHRQFRFIKIGRKLRIESEECLLAELDLDSKPAIVGILVKGAAAAAEMIRWTPLPQLEGESE